MTVDLSSRYLGLRLRTPLVASSSPLTGTLDGLRRLEDAGAAAVVLPSLFEEELTQGAWQAYETHEAGAGVFAEALDYLPDLPRSDSGPDGYLELLRRAREALAIPVIASLNGTTRGGWIDHARLIEQAGADALELNLYQVAADPALSGERVEARELELIAALRALVRIPLAVKLGPFYSAFAHFAVRVVEAGADGLVLFNRFYQPDLDLETLEVAPRVALSRSEELRLPLRWVGILRRRTKASLAASSGIHRMEDALKALLAGADAAMLASALLREGPGLLGRIAEQLERWLAEREYESVEQLKGSLAQGAVPNPEAFERANYLRTLRAGSGAYSGGAR
jgi:dihydroorotate dehydrogenase (fumarate)